LENGDLALKEGRAIACSRGEMVFVDNLAFAYTGQMSPGKNFVSVASDTSGY
jgi:hypothetical protein